MLIRIQKWLNINDGKTTKGRATFKMYEQQFSRENVYIWDIKTAK